MLAVIAIIGILAGLILPMVGRSREKAQKSISNFKTYQNFITSFVNFFKINVIIYTSKISYYILILVSTDITNKFKLCFILFIYTFN